MSETIEYELIGFSWNLQYEEPIDNACSYVREEEMGEKTETAASCDDGIPYGQSMEDIRARQQIISQFYYNWKFAHPDKRIYNKNLKDYINVRQVSIEEAKEHASKSYKSTLAFLMLDKILSEATFVTEVLPKVGNKNQAKFTKLLIMVYRAENVGTIKLTIGIMRSNKNKIQYGISALRPEQPLVDSSKSKRLKKKKASR